MKSMIALAVAGIASSASADLLITGVLDGDLPGGLPKAIELYAINDIADLSVYALGAANNGGGTDGEETFLSGSAMAGDYIYVASENVEFANFFGFGPDFTGSAAFINGDDAVELFLNGAVIDTYGDPDVNGDNEAWDYTDSYAYRIDGTTANPGFDAADYIFGGRSALDGLDLAGQQAVILPLFGTYQVPAPASLALLGLGGLVAARRR